MDPMTTVRAPADEPAYCSAPDPPGHACRAALRDPTATLTEIHGLTGAVLARDPAAIVPAAIALRCAVGNFAVDDKPTGAVVRQQPLGGPRRRHPREGRRGSCCAGTHPHAVGEMFAASTAPEYPHRAPDLP